MNRKTNTAIVFVLLIALVCGMRASFVWAGNKAMVEQRTKELDEENKQAVGQISDLPENGLIKIKANASYKEGKIQFDVYDKQISDSSVTEQASGSVVKPNSVKEETIQINNTQDTINVEKQGNDSKDN